MFRASLHDSSQVEITASFPLVKGEQQVLEIYFVLPGYLSEHYDRLSLFSDLLTRIRFHTPRKRKFRKLLVRHLLALEEYSLDAYRQQQHVYPAVYYIRVYGNYLNKRLKSFLGLFQSPDRRSNSLKRLKNEVHFFREEVFAKFHERRLTTPEPVHEAVHAVDEYISNRIFWILGRSLRRVDTDEYGAFADEVRTFLELELHHRRQQGYPCTRILPDAAARQASISRHGLLKKYVSSPLYIQSDRSSQERVYRNYFAAIAAALAASWSFLAEAQAYRVAEGRDFGFKTVLLMALVVVAYVFKDRLKENSRDFLSAKLNTNFPDYRANLSIADSFGTSRLIGTTRESSTYVPFEEMPAILTTLYRLNRKQMIESHQKKSVLCYQRIFQAEGGKRPRQFDKHVKEILRYNVTGLTRAFDDSLKVLGVYEGQEQQVAETQAARVYYLDMLIRQSEDHAVTLGHYRMHLQKGTISGFEELTPATQLSESISSGESEEVTIGS